MQKTKLPYNNGSGGKIPAGRSEDLGYSADNGIDLKMQKAQSNGSSKKAKKKTANRSHGIPTYKHSADDGIDSEIQKTQSNGSSKKEKKKSANRSHGIPTYKHSADDCIDFEMTNPAPEKAKKHEFPLKRVPSDGMDKNIVEEAFPRLRVKYKQYIAKLRIDIERSDPDQLLMKFQELKSIYDAYKRFMAVPLLCEICDVKTSEVEPLFEHYKCLKHSKNLKNPEIRKYIDFDEHSRRMVLMSKIVAMRKRGIYECELCSQTFTKRDKYAIHKKGKYHENNLYRAYCSFIIANAVNRTNRAFRL